MKSKTLRIILSALLAGSLVPAVAFADPSIDDAEGGEDAGYLVPNDGEGDPAESWRFTDGYPENYVREEMERSGIALYGAFADEDDSYRATWKSSNGVVSYTYRENPTDKDTIIQVPGVKEVGVDISYFNNEKNGVHKAIDWQAMKADGITFAIIRTGDGSTSAKGFYDPWFVNNIQGAKAAGLKVGVYIYSRALNTKASGVNSVGHEVALVLDQMNKAGLGPADLELPVYLDMEDATQRKLKAAEIGKIAQSFCSQMQAAGYRVGIYANQDWFKNVLTASCFSVANMQKNNWSRWVARYSWGSSTSGVEGTDIWQFTSIGTVAGTPRTYCDVNFSYVDFGQAAPTYTVSYQLNGGTLDAPNPVTYADTLTLPTPTRSGYLFEGWYADAALKTPVTSVTRQNATVYAKWGQSCKITYKLNGGKNNKANPSKYGGTLALKAPTRSGYTFGGWYLDKKFKSKVTKLTAKNAKSGKVTVYARWYKNYKITYKLNGGKNNKANPSKYGGTLSLKNPTRSGYIFKGWYTDKKFKKKVTKLTVTKKRTVYAKWQKGTYYKVTATDGLNIRKTASTKAKIMGTLAPGKKVAVSSVKKGWGKLADGRGWIKLEHAKKV